MGNLKKFKIKAMHSNIIVNLIVNLRLGEYPCLKLSFVIYNIVGRNKNRANRLQAKKGKNNLENSSNREMIQLKSYSINLFFICHHMSLQYIAYLQNTSHEVL